MFESSTTKSRAAVISMAVSAVLAVVKLVVALLTGSLSILSEALHSFIDLGATVVTWFAVRWADVPADDDHHYGHAKIESLAALLEACLLGLTAAYVAYAAIYRLWVNATPTQSTWWAPALLILAIVVDYNRSSALGVVAAEHESEALAADAAHFKADMLGSGAVILGLGGIALGFPWADSVAALAVAAIILWIARHLASHSLATLLDRAPEGIAQEIQTFAEHEDGVFHVEQLRVRQAGGTSYISLIAHIPRNFAATRIAGLEDRLRAKIASLVRHPDVNILLRPVALDSESANEKVMAIALERGLSIHHLIVQNLESKLAVSFDVEFDSATALSLAHEKATELESAIRDGMGGDVEVESHIEPSPTHQIEGKATTPVELRRFEKALRKFAGMEKGLSDIHNLRLRENAGDYYLHFHCRFPADLTIEKIHKVLDRVEGRLKQHIPNLVRVVAHAEPRGHSKHRL